MVAIGAEVGEGRQLRYVRRSDRGGDDHSEPRSDLEELMQPQRHRREWQAGEVPQGKAPRAGP